jgi:hypothetical protein
MPRLLLFLPLLLSSCVDFPNQYAPSRERKPDATANPAKLKAYIDMKDPAALPHLAWGVIPGAFDGESRKAEARSALRFFVPNPANLKLSIDLDSAQPQNLTFKVNGKAVGSVAAQGPTHFETPIDQSEFVPGSATLLEIEGDQGFRLRRAGFVGK